MASWDPRPLPNGTPPPPEPMYGPLVHAAVTVAGVVALIVKWRRKGSRWVL